MWLRAVVVWAGFFLREKAGSMVAHRCLFWDVTRGDLQAGGEASRKCKKEAEQTVKVQERMVSARFRKSRVRWSVLATDNTKDNALLVWSVQTPVLSILQP